MSTALKLLRMNLNEYRRSGDNLTKMTIRISLIENFNQPDINGRCSKVAYISDVEYEFAFNTILGKKYKGTRK